jgi:hypothetical protein
VIELLLISITLLIKELPSIKQYDDTIRFLLIWLAVVIRHLLKGRHVESIQNHLVFLQVVHPNVGNRLASEFGQVVAAVSNSRATML